MLAIWCALIDRLRTRFDPTRGEPKVKERRERPSERGFIIPAECHSDNYRYEASFDALPWFEQATDMEILALAAIGWGGDEEADAVARFMEDKDAEIGKLFDYLYHGPTMANGDPVGFECHIEEERVMAWLCNNRPHLAEIIDKGAEEHDPRNP